MPAMVRALTTGAAPAGIGRAEQAAAGCADGSGAGCAA